MGQDPSEVGQLEGKLQDNFRIMLSLDPHPSLKVSPVYTDYTRTLHGGKIGKGHFLSCLSKVLFLVLQYPQITCTFLVKILPQRLEIIKKIPV